MSFPSATDAPYGSNPGFINPNFEVPIKSSSTPDSLNAKSEEAPISLTLEEFWNLPDINLNYKGAPHLDLLIDPSFNPDELDEIPYPKSFPVSDPPVVGDPSKTISVFEPPVGEEPLESSPLSEPPRKRQWRRRRQLGDHELPESLKDQLRWRVGTRVRQSGKTKGLVDTYYYGPNNELCRSLREVKYVLEKGECMRRAPKRRETRTNAVPSESSGSSCMQVPENAGTGISLP